ncbi:hypothetical protein LAZ67_X004568 [Cordylochernes scorpioides]|uniref:Lipase domain-containing protein n=1 Tax=Cordylochernes scorpioides TaxID=51811 RepID=A0ABY6LVI7_9ARAC|nr:hypothetical protein LAZ67_X004568 [Cordylochernes scorpioides]
MYALGLDPAGPLFEGHDADSRLDQTDATFVDVIHTNGGHGILDFGLGSHSQMGHIDFYINGGKNQVSEQHPLIFERLCLVVSTQLGCSNVFVGAISDIFYQRWHSLCHHRRAIHLFIESINPLCKFHAFSCEDFNTFLKGKCFPCKKPDGCGLMGYYATPPRTTTEPKKMFLITRQTAPFCEANQLKININFPQELGSTYGKLSFTMASDEKFPTHYNETFVLTEESQEITDKQSFAGIIVAHPILKISKIWFRYDSYRGWIYAGKSEWGMQTFVIVNSRGDTYSFCGPITLKDGEELAISLSPGDCSATPQRVPRLVWEVVEAPQLGQPPRLVWKIELDDVHSTGHRIIS